MWSCTKYGGLNFQKILLWNKFFQNFNRHPRKYVFSTSVWSMSKWSLVSVRGKNIFNSAGFPPISNELKTQLPCKSESLLSFLKLFFSQTHLHVILTEKAVNYFFHNFRLDFPQRRYSPGINSVLFRLVFVNPIYKSNFWQFRQS